MNTPETTATSVNTAAAVAELNRVLRDTNLDFPSKRKLVDDAFRDNKISSEVAIGLFRAIKQLAFEELRQACNVPTRNVAHINYRIGNYQDHNCLTQQQAKVLRVQLSQPLA